MSGKYIPRKQQPGDSSWSFILDRCIEQKKVLANWSTQEFKESKPTMLNARLSDGSFKELDSRLCGILFNDLNKVFEEKDQSMSGTVLGSAVEIVEWIPALYASRVANHSYSGVMFMRSHVVPLALPIASLKMEWCALGNMAMSWVTNGQMGLALDDLHLTNWYMCAIHSVFVQLIAKDLSSTLYKKYLEFLQLLIKTLVHLLSIKPKTKDPLLALCDDIKASDMTQRSVAIELFQRICKDEWSPNDCKERHLSLLEVGLFRWYRRSATKNICKDLPIGVLTCLIVVPIVFHGLDEKTDKVYDSITKAVLALNVDVSWSNATSMMMQKLLSIIGVTVNEKTAFAFYKWCVSASGNKHMNYSDLGLLQMPKIPFDVVTVSVVVNGKPTVPVRFNVLEPKEAKDVKDVKDVKEAEEAKDAKQTKTVLVKMETANPSQWSGVNLSVSGVYRIQTKLSGGSQYGKGNSNKKNLVANMRFTAGPEIFPPGIAGFSSAGMEYRFDTRKYVDTGKPMDLSQPIYLVLTETQFELKDAQQKTIYSQKLHGLDVLVAFTYLHLIVQKLEDGLPKIEMSPFAKMQNEMASKPIQ